jgi:hypothetical protein
LAGDRALLRLAGQPGVQDETVRELDRLAHAFTAAYCYLPDQNGNSVFSSS